jgi:hypothetical protein
MNADKSFDRRVSDLTLQNLTKALLLAAIIVTAVLVLYGTANAVNPLLVLWTCTPYVALYVPTRLAINREGLLTSFGASVAVFALSTAVYIDGLVLNRNALNVLGLYTFPILGLVVAAVVSIIVWRLRSKGTSASDK